MHNFPEDPEEILKRMPPFNPDDEPVVSDPDLLQKALSTIDSRDRLLGATVTRNERFGNVFRAEFYRYEDQRDLANRYVFWRAADGRLHFLAGSACDAGPPLPDNAEIRATVGERPPNEHPPVSPAADEAVTTDPAFVAECEQHFISSRHVRLFGSITTGSERWGQVLRADFVMKDSEWATRLICWRGPDGEIEAHYSTIENARDRLPSA